VQARGSLLKDAREGAAFLFGNKLLLGLSLRPAVGNFAFMGANAVMVLFVRETLHLGVAAYGLYLTASALGGLGGSAIAGSLDRRLGTGGTLTLTAAVEAVALLGIGLSPNAWLAGCGEAVLGMAMGAGTDVAISAADLILLRPDLTVVPDAIALARAARRTIRRNLGWAFGYNVAAVPLAAAGFLNPLIAAAAMTMSSVLVVANSLRLRRFRVASSRRKQ